MRRVYGICRICLGQTWRESPSAPVFHCRLSNVEAHENCWDRSHGLAGKLCMDSLLMRNKLNDEQKKNRENVIRKLLPVLESGEIKLKEYLKNLSPQERGELLFYSCPRLKLVLQQLISGPE